MSYLGHLTFRLASGAKRLPEAERRRHAAFLLEAQNDDGGFSGREGPSDLYYTGLALRGLALLDRLTDEVAQRIGAFLEHRVTRPMASLDFFSLLFSAVLLEATSRIDVFAAAGHDRQELMARTVSRLRRPDGGYAKTEAGRHSSTYHTFLAVSCRQLVGLWEDEPERTIALVRSRRRQDGGFVELGRVEFSGTNPTAAAVGLLQSLDALDGVTRDSAAAFLAGMQNVEGGLRANTRTPVADLLSTFTGLVTLADLNALGAIDALAARRYVQGLEDTGGGFRGGSWDDAVDVEYTFYGLGTLALLARLDL